MKELNYMLDKMYQMNTYLGGKASEEDFRSGNVSEFKKVGKDFLKKFQIAQKYQNRRNQLKDELVVALEIDSKKQDKDNLMNKIPYFNQLTEKQVADPNKLKLSILDINTQISKLMTLMENYIDKMQMDLRKYKKGSERFEEGEEIIYKCKKLLTTFKTVEFFYIEKNIQENDFEEQKLKFEENLIDENIDQYEFSDDETQVGKKVRRKRNGPQLNQNEIDKKAKELEEMPLDKKEARFLQETKKYDKIFNRELDVIEQDLQEINVKLDVFQENLEKNKVLVEYEQNQVY